MTIPLVFVALHLEKPDIKYTKNLAKNEEKSLNPIPPWHYQNPILKIGYI